MNILDVPVSFYEHFSETDAPKIGTFLQIVTSVKLAKKYSALLAQIRAEDDKDKRDILKKMLCCFTPSGVFKNREKDGLVKHSGLLVFDIDPKENPWLNEETAPLLRDELSILPEVVYIALSASGKGVWGVVLIEKPEHHTAHFEALKSDFAGWGIKIDKGCGDVSRLRYWSYDPGHKINQTPTLYTKAIFPKTDTYTPRPHQTNATDNAAKVARILGQMSSDITAGGNGYEDWFAIGCALANEFGEWGRDYFHQASQYHPKYSRQETDKQFSACLNGTNKRYKIGTFFEIAGRYGLQFKAGLLRAGNNAPLHPTPYLPHATRPTPQPIHDEAGYPAAWDEATPPAPSRLEDAAKMFTGFALRLDDVEAAKTWEQSESEWVHKRWLIKRWYPAAFGIEKPPTPAYITRKTTRNTRHSKQAAL